MTRRPAIAPDHWMATIVLGTMTAMVPLATDIYLPSMPEMTAALGTTAQRVQLTLSIFLYGFGAAQLVYGPLSDAYGRLPALRIAFALYAASSIACTFAPTIDVLLGARFLQALGGAGPVVLARAIARDFYSGPRAGREMARMGAIMGLTPAIAPAIGAGLHVFFGWRSGFAFVALVAVVFGGFVALVMPETNRYRTGRFPAFGETLKGFGVLFANREFRVSAILNALAFSGLFGFISTGSFILQGRYGLSPTQFAFAFGACALSFAIGSLISSRVSLRRGLEGSIALGVLCLAIGGTAQTCGMLAWPASAAALIIPMMLYMVGIGFTLPSSMARAMTPFPERAGAASSAMGFVQTISGASVGALLAQLIAVHPLAFPLATMLMGGSSALTFALGRAKPKA